MVANSVQCTVCWHVNDLKVPHMDKAAVMAFLLKLAYLYCDKVFGYLALDLEYGSSPGVLIISMIK